jgi:hypothetical protein
MMFPNIEKALGQKGCMDSEIAAHEAFQEGLKAFEDWVSDTLKKPEAYNAGRLKELVDGFAKPLMSHLNTEILALTRLKEWDPDGSIVKKLYKELEEVAVRSADTVRSLTSH